MRAALTTLAACAVYSISPLLAQNLAPAGRGEPSEADWGKADNIPIERVPDVEPASREAIMSSLRKGVDFLLENQNENGSWGGYTNTKNSRLSCPWPSGPRTFRAASTALCIIGLEKSPMRNEPRVQEAMIRAEDFLFEEMKKIKPGNVRIIYNAWAHAYALEAYAYRAASMPKDSPRYLALKKSAEQQIKSLDYLAYDLGGWGYILPDRATIRPDLAYPTSFTTATVFVALKAAEDVFGIKPDAKKFANSMKYLKSQRTPAGTYVYSERHTYKPQIPINRHTGSLARSPACDYSVLIYDPDFISTRQLNDDLERLWSRSGWLMMSLKKPKPHESFAANSGYFVFYGYYYVSLCFDLLPKETLHRHASHLVDDVLPLQEKDGSWWDYPVYNYHKFYGTGYCLFAMSRAWDILYGNQTNQSSLTRSGNP